MSLGPAVFHLPANNLNLSSLACIPLLCPPHRLACKQLGVADRALDALHRVLQLAPIHAEAMLLVADIHDELGDAARASEWFTRLASRAPHDSGALRRHGGLLSRWGRQHARACKSNGG